MKKKFKLDQKIILYLASLSNLIITQKETTSLLKKLEETRYYIENLNKLNTKNIDPTAQTGNINNVVFKDGEENKRKLSKEQVFKNSRNIKDNYFVTKKIL